MNTTDKEYIFMQFFLFSKKCFEWLAQEYAETVDSYYRANDSDTLTNVFLWFLQ